MQKKDKIFVAGHKGMFGSAIVRVLKKNGFENLILKTRKELDLLDQKKVESFFQKEKPSYVFLAAAKVGGIQANISSPTEFLLENLIIQNNVIYSAFKFGVKKLCFLGSSCVYPRECPQPMKEEYLMTGPLEPTNEGYALAKIAGLKLCQYLEKQYGFNSICPMPCNLYGTNDSFDPQNSHVLSAVVKKFIDAKDENRKEIVMWGTGKARRELMHVDDAAEAVFFLMQKHNSSSIINVGWGEDFSIKELAEKVAMKTGFKGKIVWDTTKPDGMPRKCLDTTKINKMGFFPKINLDQGIEMTIQEYQKIKNKKI